MDIRHIHLQDRNQLEKIAKKNHVQPEYLLRNSIQSYLKLKISRIPSLQNVKITSHGINEIWLRGSKHYFPSFRCSFKINLGKITASGYLPIKDIKEALSEDKIHVNSISPKVRSIMPSSVMLGKYAHQMFISVKNLKSVVTHNKASIKCTFMTKGTRQSVAWIRSFIICLIMCSNLLFNNHQKYFEE